MKYENALLFNTDSVSFTSIICLVCISLEHTGPLDVVYAVDTTSMENDLRGVRNLIINGIKSYNLENGTTRVGLLTYGGAMPKDIVKFPSTDKAGFSLATDLVEHTPGEGNIVEILNLIKDSVYKESNLRKNVKKLVILYVNGNRPIPNLPTVESTLRSLNKSNIGYVIVIVGSLSADAAKLKTSAGKYGTVVHKRRPEELPDMLPFIIKAGMQRKGKKLWHLSCFKLVFLVVSEPLLSSHSLLSSGWSYFEKYRGESLFFFRKSDRPSIVEMHFYFVVICLIHLISLSREKFMFQ